MVELRKIAEKIRSKNAGPFWLTIDVFCKNRDDFLRVCEGLKTPLVADLFGIDTQMLKRFDIADLNAIKFSLPRPAVQGTRADRDMHGAAWAVLLEELDIS
ncbi:MAG: DUF4387 family protein [Albidovulum sp.]